MRNIKFLSLAAILIIMITAQSCKKGFFDGVNDNPNLPTEVTARVILPGAEGSLAYSQGGDVERFTSIMVQYITGANRQFAGYNNYVFTEEDFNNLWYNMYAGTMENYKAIMNIEAANPGAYNTYDAIARIQMAYALGMVTDLWGDVPYAEAFQGNINLTPAYQSQQSVYDSIQGLLTTAINELNAEQVAGDDLDVPDANDFIYGGDVAKWTSFAHALKARYYIHLTKVDGSGGTTAAQQALNEITAGGDISDANYPFSSTGHSPWYQYIEQRDDIAYSGTCLDTMQSRNDPRYPIYNDVNGDYWGVGYLGSFFSADASPVYLMTYFEEAFIEAEANLRLGNTETAQTNLQDAINASFTFYGLDPTGPEETAYVATYGQLSGSFDEELQTIITEKWIANYLHPESWVDFRRTGYPALAPNAGAAGAIPARFIYPTDERLYNPNGINQNSTVYAPALWWNP